MTLKQIRKRFGGLGYLVQTQVTDDMGRKWRYHTAPAASGGSHGYFQKKAELVKYLLQVEENRR